ncbi:MAG: asparagine synthase (glutamine-hydrolyzing) [Bacteroidales bacterium]|nr:asparagine synthase (glutamine-hydrolyzing) [Bacteroidales bacterium]
MCGIAGIIDFYGKATSTAGLISMMRAISYRGPDESGIYHSQNAALGHVRLSILDPESGQQPLSDTTGRYIIVLNGEIFNYRELRTGLEKKGYIFNTSSDTEVLLQLYIQHGKDCLGMLNGQFAFAVWDKHEEILFLARDRVGIRPLFYNITDGVFTFASEIKALFEQPFISRELRHESLSQIYTFWTTLTPYTVFKNIYELSPGHYLHFSQNGIKINKYWSPDFSNVNREIKSGDALERLHELFNDAVKLRLHADVKVAAYLSGGLDSASTVAYIKDIEVRSPDTFSIGFEEKDFDEGSYQKEAVQFFDTQHKSVVCSSETIADIFPKVVWHSEIPMTRTAPAPMLILSGLVRENNIKAVITGEGSDEILAGYDIFREAKIRKFWASQPDSATRPLLLKTLYPDIAHLRNASPNILRMFFGYKLNDVDNPFYSHLLRWNNGNHIKKNLSAALKNTLDSYSPPDELSGRLPAGFNEWDLLAKAQWLETTVFMSGYLLSTQGDRMAMANSVEGRYPFLDHRVIEFCSTLPPRLKLNGLNEKFLLKKLMTNRIPENILKRPKHPYRAPISSVFLDGDVPEYVKMMLSASYIRKAGIFDPDAVSSLLSKIEKTGVASEVDNMTLTAVISTHLLYYQFIENNNREFQKGELKNLKIVRNI